MASDLHAIYCPLWAIFFILLLEALRNWHDRRHRHPRFMCSPDFMRRHARRIPSVGLLRGAEIRRAGGGVGSCPPPSEEQA